MKHTPPPVTEGLPASLVDVAEALGLRVALALIQNFGGLDVKFPKDPSPDHPVIKALGEEDGRALCQFLGGQQIYVPHARPAKSARADVQRMEAAGMDRAAIARSLGLSARHVRRVANSEDDPKQPRLFEE
jgi:hypothetical protein